MAPPRHSSPSPFLACPLHWTLLPDGSSHFSVGSARFLWPCPCQPIPASGVFQLCAPASAASGRFRRPPLLSPPICSLPAGALGWRVGSGSHQECQPSSSPLCLTSLFPGPVSPQDLGVLGCSGGLPCSVHSSGVGWRPEAVGLVHLVPPTLLCFPGDPLLSHRLGYSRPPEGYLPFRERCPTDLAFSAVLSFSFFLLFLLSPSSSPLTHPKPLGASSPAHHRTRMETLG